MTRKSQNYGIKVGILTEVIHKVKISNLIFLILSISIFLSPLFFTFFHLKYDFLSHFDLRFTKVLMSRNSDLKVIIMTQKSPNYDIKGVLTEVIIS